MDRRSFLKGLAASFATFYVGKKAQAEPRRQQIELGPGSKSPPRGWELRSDQSENPLGSSEVWVTWINGTKYRIPSWTP